MKKWLECFRTEDWIIVAAGMLILVLSLAAPGWMPRMPEKFAMPADAAKGLGLYLFLLVLTAGCQRLLRRPAGGLALSLAAIFALAMLASAAAATGPVREWGRRSASAGCRCRSSRSSTS